MRRVYGETIEDGRQMQITVHDRNARNCHMIWDIDFFWDSISAWLYYSVS